ncbi:MAG: MFS transporter [Chitinivibrionales bacterium]
MSLKSTFRALRYRNYRLFFLGQGTSLIGTWMQRIATSWLVYRLTGSAVLLGVVGFVSQIPTFILSPVGGVVADRWNKKTIFFVTQIFALLQALVLAILVIKGAITVPWIIALNIILGIINAFDVTARQSFVVEMIENKEDLGNAIALNSSMVNGARLIGPSITGILIASMGEGICFFINSMSYVVIIFALLFMKIPQKEKVVKNTRMLHDFKEGFTYIYASVPMRSIILLLALVSLLGMPYQVLMPVFAKQVLGGGPHTLGFLMGAAGLGALCGAMFLASRKSGYAISKLIPAAAVLFGAGLIAFSFSKVLWLSLLLLLFAGCGMMVQMASSNTSLQVLVDDDKRGRVMALYAMAFMGMAPFGSLLAGGLAGLIGAPHTLLVGGVLCIFGAFLFSKNILSAQDKMRSPEKELSPEIETGIESSEEVTESV